MTHSILAGSLSREFGGRSQAAVFHRFQKIQRDDRKRREREDKVEDSGSDLLDMAGVMVSSAEISAFRLEIDRYDAATIEALYANETALALIMQQKEELLMQAYVLPDGRRVFKSEDGIRVFDEHGIELGADDIDPDLINENRPSWETYKRVFDEETRLVQERAELISYQTTLDDARERLDAGEISQTEFDALRDELTTAMPDAVRAQIPELADEQEPAPDASAPASNLLDISDDMRPTTTAPAFSA